MKRISSITLSCLIFSLLFSPARAQDLIDVYRQALKNDPTWAVQEASYFADKEQKNQVKSLLRPNVAITYSKTRSQRSAADIGVEFSEDSQRIILDCANDTANCDVISHVAVPLVTGEGLDGLFTIVESDSKKARTTVDNFSIQVVQSLFHLENWYRYRSAKALSSKLDAEFALAEQEFIIKVAESYFNVLRAAEEVVFSKAEQSAIGQQLNQTKQAYKLGLGRITDMHEAQGAYDLSQTAVIVSEGLLQSAQEQLFSLTNQRNIQLAKLAEDFPISVPQPAGAEAWVQMALERNNTLMASRFAVNAADNLVVEKNAQYAPTVDLFASMDNIKTDAGDDNPLGTAGNLTSDSDSQTLGIRLTLPLYNGGLTSSQTREAKHRQAASRAQLEAQVRRLTALCRELYRNVENDVRRIEVIRLTISSNESALEATQTGYAEGTRNVFDVLQAQRSLFSAKRDYANARYDYLINSLKLKQAAGILEAVDLKILNEWLQPS